MSPTAPPANSLNTELAATEGHAKVAVKATDLGGGNWRYDYAVENLDFARAIIQAPQNGPDPRVVSNKGFDSFSVPIPAGATVVSTSFHDGDLERRQQLARGDQRRMRSRGASAVRSSRRRTPRPPTLDWGTMYSFSRHREPRADERQQHAACRQQRLAGAVHGGDAGTGKLRTCVRADARLDRLRSTRSANAGTEKPARSPGGFFLRDDQRGAKRSVCSAGPGRNGVGFPCAQSA